MATGGQNERTTPPPPPSKPQKQPLDEVVKKTTLRLPPPRLVSLPWNNRRWPSYSAKGKEDKLKTAIKDYEEMIAGYQSGQKESEERKAGLEREQEQAGETVGRLEQLEAVERGMKGCERDIKLCQEGITQCQERLKSEEEAQKRSKEILENALQVGYIWHQLTKVIFTGVAGTGKSSVKALLLGDPPPAVRHSTPCAEKPVRARSVSHMKIKAQGKDWLKVNQEKLLSMVGNTLPQLQEQVLDSLTKSVPAKPVPPISSPDPTSSPSQKAQSARQQEPKPIRLATASERAADEAIAAVFQKLTDKIESISEDNKSDRLAKESLLNSKLLHFIDSGGQPQFLEMFRIFLHKATTNICVLRLLERLDEHPNVEYYKDGEPLGQPHPAPHTNEEIVKCLIRSMQSQLTVDDNGTIVLVGTHLDKEHECSESLTEKNRRLFELLNPLIDSLELYNSCNNEVIFPVNTKEPGEHENKVASLLRKLIEQHTPEAIKFPIWWYVLELLLQQLSALLERNVLSYDECLNIATKLNFDEEAFRAALKYLHELNLFLYYPEILPNVVFSNPQVPLDKLTELVERSYELRHGTQVKGNWLKFRDLGIVQESFLYDPHFSEHYVEGLFSPLDLLKLFQELLILAPLSPTEYLMPCLLETLPPARLEEHRAMDSEVFPLLIHFPHGWPRSGVFCCLVVHLINRCKWKLSLRSGKPLLVTKKCIKFRVPSSPPCTVALVDSYAYYEVHVHIKAPLIKCQHLYSSIRQTLFNGVEAASRNLHYDNSTPYAAFFCPHRHPNQAGMLCTAQLNAEMDYWECSVDEEHVGETTAQHSIWFHEQVVKPLPTAVPSCLESHDFQTKGGAGRTRVPQTYPHSASGLSIFSQRPLERELHVIRWRDEVGVMQRYHLRDVFSVEWRALGVMFSMSEGLLNQVAVTNSNDPFNCFTAVLSHWLEASSEDYPTTWSGLITALEDVGGFQHKIKELRTILEYKT